MKTTIVYFPEKERAALKEEEVNTSLTGSEVLVRSDYDVISAGTELANYHGVTNTSPTGDVNECTYPRYIGYSVSGHVIAIGPDVKNLKINDRVVVPWGGHRSVTKKNEDQLFPIPDGVDSKTAAFTHLASFPMLGVRKLKIELGESAMVAGLGLLGMFAVQFAKLSGAYPVLACDYSPERRALALKLGADFVLDPREENFIEKVRELTPLTNPSWRCQGGPKAVVEVTGFLSGFKQALDYTAHFGRISVLGCTRISDEPINIYRYIHWKGIQIVGAHTMSRPGLESQPGMWTEKDDYATFMKLVLAKKLQVEPIISQVVDPRDAEEVYHRIGFEKNPPFGFVFDWTKIDI